MIKTQLSIFLTLVAMPVFSSYLYADNLVIDPSLEEPDASSHWTIYIPEESKGANCHATISTDSPHSGSMCALLQSDVYARYTYGPKQSFKGLPGEQYRISVWVRSDPAAQAEPGTPGVLVRILMRSGDNDSAGGHIYLGLDNKITRKDLPSADLKLPTKWTKMEGVFTFPDDADSFVVGLCAWYLQGRVYFDDLTVEKVDDSTPASN